MVWSYKFKNIEGRSEKVLSERAVEKIRDMFQNPKEKSLGTTARWLKCAKNYFNELKWIGQYI